jgi:hypothetical protein
VSYLLQPGWEGSAGRGGAARADRDDQYSGQYRGNPSRLSQSAAHADGRVCLRGILPHTCEGGYRRPFTGKLLRGGGCRQGGH